MALVTQRSSLLWARNDKNISALKTRNGRPFGVYVLCDGSMPIYVGKGDIYKRVLKRHRKRSSKSKFWDHFRWFQIDSAGARAEVEALLLTILPFYLRSMNKQTASLSEKNKARQVDDCPVAIKRPKLYRSRSRSAS